jgi:hypothetical protein
MCDPVLSFVNKCFFVVLYCSVLYPALLTKTCIANCSFMLKSFSFGVWFRQEKDVRDVSGGRTACVCVHSVRLNQIPGLKVAACVGY